LHDVSIPARKLIIDKQQIFQLNLDVKRQLPYIHQQVVDSVGFAINNKIEAIEDLVDAIDVNEL